MAQTNPALPNTTAYLSAVFSHSRVLSPNPHHDSLPDPSESSSRSTASSKSSDPGSAADDAAEAETSRSQQSQRSGSEGALTAQDQIMRILNDVDEDDQPDQLKSVLSSLLPGTSGLDEIVLGLLHRHREDLNPTGQKFDNQAPLLPHSSSSSQAASLSRSTGTPLSRNNSLRKTTHAAATLALQRSNSALLINQHSRPSSPSPLRAGSPSPFPFPRTASSSAIGGPSFFAPGATEGDQDADGLGYSSGGEQTGGRSPFSSPRISLHVGASEFRPKSAMGGATSTSSAPGSTTSRTARSTLPQTLPPSSSSSANNLPTALNLNFGAPGSRSSTPGAEGRNVWAFNPSPLGTPKFAPTPIGGGGGGGGSGTAGALTPSRTPSAAGGPTESYFANGGGGENERPIPRDPWNDDEGRNGVDAGAAVMALEEVQNRGGARRGVQDPEMDPFSPFSSLGSGITPSVTSRRPGAGMADPPTITTVDADAGSVGEEDALEWGLSPAMAREMERFSSWDPFEPEFDAEMSPPPASRPLHPHQHQFQAGTNGGLYAQGHASNNGGYTMTPFDELWASVAGTGVTPEQMEEALQRCGYDATEAMDFLISRVRNGTIGIPGGGGFSPASSRPISPSALEDDGSGQLGFRGANNLAPNPAHAVAYPNDPTFPQRARFAQAGSAGGAGGAGAAGGGVGAGGNRPALVARDSFDRRNGPRSQSPLGSAPSSPRWANRPLTPTGEQKSGGPSNRVCRFYLQGACLRSDCRFSHDVSKAVCRFWLRGHCLKGENRCDFAHEIPHVLNARLQMLDAQNEGRRSPSWESLAQAAQQEAAGLDPSESDLVEFPSLGEAAARRVVGSASPPDSSQGQAGEGFVNNINDPARTRWSGAVKNGRPIDARIARQGLEARKALRSGMPLDGFIDSDQSAAGGSASPAEIRSRPSQRIGLRPPALLPQLPTGSSLAQLYATYRSGFLELGAHRNRCFQKANECFRRGDGAGAKRFSREGAEWNKRVIDEGRAAATAILAERNRLTKDAVTSMDRNGRADDTADRMHRGRELGGGVCLGVAHAQAIADGAGLSVKERMEVVMDLHGLHPDEGIDSLERFLLSLHQDGFIGLAYVVVGESKHTGTSDPARGSGKARLSDAIVEFLSLRTRYPWRLFDGVVCIDPCL